MSKKITELPTSTTVQPAFYVPLVNTTAPTGNATEKATLTMVAQGLNGLIATLTGSFFTGPVTASLGVSSSFVNLGGSGNTWPNAGAIRVPYNQGNSDKIITAKYFDNTTDLDFLTYGATTWTVGNTANSIFTYAAGLLNYSQTSISNYFFNDWQLLNQTRGTTDVLFTTTGATFGTPITASIGVSASHVSFGPSPSPNGYIRTSGGALMNWWDGTSNRPVIAANNGTYEVEFGAAASGYTKVQGYTLTFDSYAGSTFTSTPTGAPTTFNTPVTASKGLYVGGPDVVTFAHSGSTIESYDAYLQRTTLKRHIAMTSTGTETVLAFTGSNGRTYLAKADIIAQHSTTTSSYATTYTSHFYMSGGLMRLVGSVGSAPSSTTTSAPVTMSTALSSSGEAIILNATLSGIVLGGTFNWGGFMTVQEVG